VTSRRTAYRKHRFTRTKIPINRMAAAMHETTMLADSTCSSVATPKRSGFNMLGSLWARWALKITMNFFPLFHEKLKFTLLGR